MNKLAAAFFEDLVVAAEFLVDGVAMAVEEPDSNTQWAEDLAPYRRLSDALGGDASDLRVVLKESMIGLIHSFLVTLDGGTACAEIGRLNLVSEEDGEILADGLHEIFFDHLWDTGRIEPSF